MVKRFPETLKEALNIIEKINIEKHTSPLRSIYITGLGGSGIGGGFVQDFVAQDCKLPIIVNKGYEIHRWVNKHTLAICSSYSGGTEETLNAFEQLRATGAKIVCISSGGELIKRAKQHGYDYVLLPGGWSSPRACMGFSITAQLGVLRALKLIPLKLINQVAKAASNLEKQQERIEKDGHRLAATLHGKLPIIYTTDRNEAVAMRWRQQINENSKMLCWHHVIPEMNHNEIMGWHDEYPNAAVVWLRNRDDLPRNQTRTSIVQSIINPKAGASVEVWSKGSSFIEKTLYLVHLGDFMSVSLAELHGVDAIEIGAINHLKGELAQQK